MPATGVSGVDLYVRHGTGWRWLATGQPRAQTNTATLAIVDELHRHRDGRQDAGLHDPRLHLQGE